MIVDGGWKTINYTERGDAFLTLSTLISYEYFNSVIACSTWNIWYKEIKTVVALEFEVTSEVLIRSGSEQIHDYHLYQPLEQAKCHIDSYFNFH